MVSKSASDLSGNDNEKCFFPRKQKQTFISELLTSNVLITRQSRMTLPDLVWYKENEPSEQPACNYKKKN